MLFNADILAKLYISKVNLEKQKKAKETFSKKLKTWNKMFTRTLNRLSNNLAQGILPNAETCINYDYKNL